jgi:hypothetical protein
MCPPGIILQRINTTDDPRFFFENSRELFLGKIPIFMESKIHHATSSAHDSNTAVFGLHPPAHQQLIPHYEIPVEYGTFVQVAEK